MGHGSGTLISYKVVKFDIFCWSLGLYAEFHRGVYIVFDDLFQVDGEGKREGT